MRYLTIFFLFTVQLLSNDVWGHVDIGNRAKINDFIEIVTPEVRYSFLCNYGIYRSTYLSWKSGDDVTNLYTNGSINNVYGKFTFYRLANTSSAVLASIKGGSLLVTKYWGALWEYVEAEEIGEIKSFYVNSKEVILAGTTKGLFQSTDDGFNWTKVNTGLDDVIINEFKTDNNGNLYGCSEGVLIKRNSLTEKWTLINLDSIVKTNIINDIAFLDSQIYIASDSGVVVSIDNGKTWKRFLNILMDKHITSLAAAYGKVFAGTKHDGLYYTQDSGKTWIMNWYEMKNQSIERLKIRPYYPNFSIFGCGYGLFHDWENATGFDFGSVGYPDVQILFFDSENIMFYFADENIFCQFPNVNSDNRTMLLPQKRNTLYFGIDSSDNIYYSGFGLPLYRITDEEFSKGESKFTVPDSSVVSVTNMAVSEDGAIFAINIEGKVFSSRDNGMTWRHEVSFDSTFHISYNKNKQLFAVDKENFLVSDNNGNSWNKHPNNFSAQFNDSISAYQLLNNVIIFAGDCGIYYSEDFGATWAKANGTPCYNYNNILSVGNELYASCDSGVYRSLDNGKSWHNFSDGLPRLKNCKMMAVDKEGYVYVATKYFGLYRSISPANSVPEIHKNENNVALYPNPSNSIVNFFVPEDGNVKTIELYDVIGNKIAINPAIMNYFDVSGLSAGIYFIKIYTDNKIYFEKLSVVR